MKLITLALVSLPVFINILSVGITEINIHNNYSAPISYAVDSNPKEAIEQFNTVKKWMEDNRLTNGNTCVFIKTNPYCELNNFYSNRVVTSITESSNVNDAVAISNLSLKLNERFIGKSSNGAEYVKKPINLNIYLRYGSLTWLGWWIDLICYSYFVVIWFLFYLLS